MAKVYFCVIPEEKVVFVWPWTGEESCARQIISSMFKKFSGAQIRTAQKVDVVSLEHMVRKNERAFFSCMFASKRRKQSVAQSTFYGFSEKLEDEASPPPPLRLSSSSSSSSSSGSRRRPQPLQASSPVSPLPLAVARGSADALEDDEGGWSEVPEGEDEWPEVPEEEDDLPDDLEH